MQKLDTTVQTIFTRELIVQQQSSSKKAVINVIDPFRLKFILGFEAWGNKTKEACYSLLSLKIDFFCFIPQVSQPSINPAINTQFLSRTATNKTKHVTSKLRSVFLYKAKSPRPMKVNEDLESQLPLKPNAKKCMRITTFNRNYILSWIKWNHQKLKICIIRGSLRSMQGWVGYIDGWMDGWIDGYR